MGIFSEEAGSLGILQGNIGPGSNFFDFIKNEASNALGLNQSIGQTPPVSKSFVRQGFGSNPNTGEEFPQPRTFFGQQPDCRIFIKKKSFGGFRSNFSSSLLSSKDRIYSKVLKRLFAQKIEVLGQAELLTKFVNKISNNQSFVGRLATNTLAELFRNGSDTALFDGLMYLSKEEERISNTNISRWIIDPDDTDSQNLGIGTGVIELTNVSSIASNLNLDQPGDLGSVNLTMEDPFNIMLITPVDIERAINTERTALNKGIKTAAAKLDQVHSSIQKLNNVTSTINSTRNPGEKLENIKLSFSNTNTNPLDDPGKISIGRSAGAKGISPLSEDNSADNILLFQEEEKPFRNVVSEMKEYQSMSNDLRERFSSTSTNDLIAIQQDLLKTFAGRTIINAMDNIYVFISSNGINEEKAITIDDNKQSESFYRSEWANKNTSGELPNSITQDLYVQLQKQKLLKSNRSGSIIFVGLVDTVNRNYAEGKHLVRVNGSGNMKWLGFSKINTQPSISQPQGALTFPLTPFEEKIGSDGSVTLGLLEANKSKLTDNEQSAIESQIKVDPSSVRSIGNFENLVFKWKRGLYSTSARVAFRSSVSNDPKLITENDAQVRFGLLINDTAFANLDAANVITMLVCGVPYNFSSFLKDAVRSGIYTTGPNSSRTYASSVLSVASIFNDANGQFEPLIQINVLPEDYHDTQRSSFFISDVDSQIAQLQKTIEGQDELSRQADLFLKTYQKISNDPNINQNRGLLAGSKSASKVQLEDLNKELESLTAIKKLRLTERNASYREALLALQDPTQSNTLEGDSSDINLRIRHLQAFLYRRQFKSIGDILLGKDKSYLVIANEYEEDFDIQAFVQRLRGEGPDLWQSHYESPLDVCKHVSQVLDFEFFNDTNGNIHFRPPQYNKTPLSVFQQLLRVDKTKKIFPESFKSLLKTREGELKKTADKMHQDLDAEMLASKKPGAVPMNELTFNNRLKKIEEYETASAQIQTQLKTVAGLTIEGLLQPSNPLFDKFVEVDQLLPTNEGKNKVDRQSIEAINQRFDDIGFNSHKRFVISDDVIVSFSFDESAPPYTKVDVTGQTNLVDISDVSKIILWAGAVDYDLWRQFGFIPLEVTKPYFRSPELQCKPYAEFLLSRARKQIVKGTVSVIGNEYYQLGDVVFFEPYGLLFYVTGIQHEFTFESQYITTLTLSYGRAPGEFIPTPLDIIGKNLIQVGGIINAVSSELSESNRVVASKTDVTIKETSERVLGVIEVSDDGLDSLSPTPNNYKESLRVLSLANGLIGKVSFSAETRQPVINRIIIRFFEDNDSAGDAVEEWLQSPTNLLNNEEKLNLYNVASNLVGAIEIGDVLMTQAFDPDTDKYSSEVSSFFKDNDPTSDTNLLSTLVEVRVITSPIDADQINKINESIKSKVGLKP